MAEMFRITGMWKEDGSFYFSDESGRRRTDEMNPPELLTAALVSCTGITMQTIMKRMKIEHGGFTITGVAGKVDGEPVRFNPVTLDVSIYGAALSEGQQKRLLDLTDKYCPVTQTLRKGAEITLNIDS